MTIFTFSYISEETIIDGGYTRTGYRFLMRLVLLSKTESGICHQRVLTTMIDLNIFYLFTQSRTELTRSGQKDKTGFTAVVGPHCFRRSGTGIRLATTSSTTFGQCTWSRHIQAIVCSHNFQLFAHLQKQTRKRILFLYFRHFYERNRSTK